MQKNIFLFQTEIVFSSIHELSSLVAEGKTFVFCPRKVAKIGVMMDERCQR